MRLATTILLAAALVSLAWAPAPLPRRDRPANGTPPWPVGSWRSETGYVTAVFRPDGTYAEQWGGRTCAGTWRRVRRGVVAVDSADVNDPRRDWYFSFREGRRGGPSVIELSHAVTLDMTREGHK